MHPYNRRHSIASSTGSLSDDLFHLSGPQTSGYAYSPAAGDTSFALSDTDSPYLGSGAPARSSTTLPPAPPLVATAASTPAGTPFVGESATGGVNKLGGRSRARAFSFLSVHPAQYGERHDADGPSPATGETPFVGGAYDFALDGDEVDALDYDDDEDDSDERRGRGVEMREMGASAAGGTGAAAGKAYRMRFQPLEGYELAWMAVSASAVLGLTVTAVVLSVVG
ncbi:hypothetical protein Rhopal_007657-T1 [Rhodotorula paludigena]|uniref:Uncharacterized protein n=1 Tax=Rhodotorula paludigena TaxID=86838 RepID=A0AAV5GX90_9BASI|nr:hypothetical protein Rhopal_007657-T1 [Rhodotorula paludigena]